MHIHLNLDTHGSRVSDEKLRRLHAYVQGVADRNGVPLFLHLGIEGKARTTLKMKEAVPLKRDTVNFIQTLLEQENARIDFR